LYFQTKDDEKAIPAYRKAIELAPKTPNGYQRLAFILSEKPKNYEEALKLATKAVELAPQDPISLDIQGWVYVQQGKNKKGLEKLKEASKLLPQDPVISYHLGVAYFKDNNPQEAKKYLRAALNISKNFRGSDQGLEILKKVSK
jgi:tetratricopeptide (TPR) repeat protein